MKKLQVGVALSGGVDSTATALLLKKHYNVTGFFMQLAQPDLQRQIERVRDVAGKLDIPLRIMDLAEDFEKRVLNYFRSRYRRGLTPNPCVVCNTEIKFGLLLDGVIEAGMEKMATGHYVRLKQSGRDFQLHKGVDPAKDQSYFLARLGQAQLAGLLFPLGEHRKKDIYDYVEEHGFNFFRGGESQDVCFLQGVSVGKYLQKHSACTPGAIVTADGTVLGRHSGIGNYTVGQRRGLGISADRPLYVVAIDAHRNEIVVGGNDELYSHTLLLDDLHWLAGRPPSGNHTFQVKIRSTHSGGEAKLQPAENGRMRLHFKEAQRAAAPGQFGVIYRGDEVLGAGEIVGQPQEGNIARKIA